MHVLLPEETPEPHPFFGAELVGPSAPAVEHPGYHALLAVLAPLQEVLEAGPVVRIVLINCRIQ